jgi:hypothetical protein
VRRVDPKKRTIGEFLITEINPLLSDNIFIGVP